MTSTAERRKGRGCHQNFHTQFSHYPAKSGIFQSPSCVCLFGISSEAKNNYYIVSGRNNTSQYLFDVKTKPEVFCNKPVQVYPTNYDSLYVVFDFGGFDLASGKIRGFSGGTEHLQYYQPSVSSDGKLFVHKPESTPYR